jgi:hypothetical protein
MVEEQRERERERRGALVLGSWLLAVCIPHLSRVPGTVSTLWIRKKDIETVTEGLHCFVEKKSIRSG